ncbi:MAG: thioesterase [Planctomycetota bacterium]|nr:MAG: thioesterase [Planctomycetota bacterium]
MTTSAWFPSLRRQPNPRVRLLCLPFAGGGSLAFRGWQQLLGSEIELWAACPPGRERRLGEVPHSSMDEYLTGLEQAADEVLSGPWAVFGHSFGALAAHALARRRALAQQRAPTLLAVSGARAPWLEPLPPLLRDLPKDRFLEELGSLGGTPPAVLEHPELMDLFLPALRADTALSEAWSLPAPELLAVPLLVLGGEDDEESLPERIAAWRQGAAAGHSQRLFPGGHFYVQPERDALLDCLRAALLGG